MGNTSSSSSSSSSGASSMASTTILPEDLMADILSRLPAKSICRFRCVSKPWSNLFSDSGFIKMHLTKAVHSDDRYFIALTKEGNFNFLGDAKFDYMYWVKDNSLHKGYKIRDPLVESTDDYSLGFITKMEDWFVSTSRILGSCNGVVCLVKGSQVCLLNPCTREYKIVSFDVTFYSNAIYGFGYDFTRENYKLVEIKCNPRTCKSYMSVFSLNDTSYSAISDVPYGICEQSGVYLNGVIYWVAKSSNLCVVPHKIVSFHVGTNVVGELPTPDCLDIDASLAVGLVGGQLALLKWTERNIETWVMGKSGGRDQWCKLLLINEHIDSWECCYHSWRLRPSYFVSADLEEASSRIFNLHGILKVSAYERIVTHVPSRVSLNSGTFVEAITYVEME